jgi:ankyrin repeat protein
MVFVMNMKKLMMFVALLSGMPSIVIYSMEEEEEQESQIDKLAKELMQETEIYKQSIQKEKETEEGGRGVKREREPERCPTTAPSLQPPRKRIKMVAPLTELAIKAFYEYGMEQEEFTELLESIPEITGIKEQVKTYAGKKYAEREFPLETTPLHEANTALQVQNLIELGFDPNQRNYKDQTAINALIDRGNLEGAYYLLEHFGEELDLVTPDEFGVDPLQNAIRRRDPYLANEIISILVRQNKAPEVMRRRNKDEFNIIDLVLKNRLGELLPIIIKAGADINSHDINGVTPLMVAAHYFAESIPLLVEKGARLEDKTNEGNTALISAIFFKNKEAVELLLEAGANANDRNSIKNTTPLVVAVQHFAESIPLLVEKGAGLEDKNKALRYAINNENDEAIQLLLASGADINAQNMQGFTPLTAAIYDSDITLVELLLRHGADVNLRDQTGQTPLMVATGSAHREDIVKLLIKYGAQIQIKDNDGKTAFMHAIDEDAEDVVIILINNGGLDFTELKYAKDNDPEMFELIEREYADKILEERN